MLRAVLKCLAIGLMIGLFVASITCTVYAYRTWRGSAVTVHRGPGATQRRTVPLSEEDRERIQALLSGAAVSGVIALGLLAALPRGSGDHRA